MPMPVILDVENKKWEGTKELNYENLARKNTVWSFTA
jgi:hypothetical protein